ncbi:MAG: helix-turn-helix domain-containing protein [Pseudonocardiaceae bacterium]
MTTLGAKPRCPDCGARLRRGREAGTRCDPCQRAGTRLMLPESFYDQPGLEAALAGGDFGPVFLAVRAHTSWSQDALAEFLGLEQGRISRIETGRRALLELGLVVRVANKLAIPAGKLGFTHGITVGGGTSNGRKGSWVDRRDFVEHVAALAVGATGAAGLDIDRLTALLPHAEPTGTRHVGAADVEALERATAAFVGQDFAHGSAMVRDTAVAQLHATLPLLGAQASPEVRPRLYLATARLATQVGWMSFDVNHHDAARRLWMMGLDIARHAEDPQGSDLTVFVLYDMALQAVHLGRPDEALRLVHLGHSTAAGPHPVSASTISCLANIQAKAHAAQKDAAGCDRALGHAVEHFAATDPATQPPWASSLGDEAHLAAYQGHAHYTLALASRDPHAAERAVLLLRRAVDDFSPGYARSRALYLADLVGAHALAGDTDTAVTLGHQAIDAVTALHSPRAYDRLRALNIALEPLHTSPGVTELRDRLSATAA